MANNYNDALERAKQAIIDCGSNASRKEMIYSIFPELRESEDERIRKEMIEYFSQYKEDGLRGVDITPWIAYLERQKGQKPLSTEETELNSIVFLEQMGYTCIHRESRLHNSHNGPYFEKAVNDLRTVACLFANWKDEPSRKTNDGKLSIDIDTVEIIINANRVIQKSDVFDWNQAYQKGLNHGEIAGYNKAMKEQKPAEWSEKDERMLERVIDTIGDSILECDCDDTGTKARFALEEERKWLKSLPERFK